MRLISILNELYDFRQLIHLEDLIESSVAGLKYAIIHTSCEKTENLDYDKRNILEIVKKYEQEGFKVSWTNEGDRKLGVREMRRFAIKVEWT